MKNNPKSPYSKKSNGLYLHASSVNIKGKALLFLGHSSSGKSTISYLLSKQYPVIADDKVWIYQNKNGEWHVYDGINHNHTEDSNLRHSKSSKSYPLLALIRIFKSDKTDIQPVSPRTTCSHLIDAVFEVDYQRNQMNIKIKKKWFKIVGNIARNFEGWHLTFKKDSTIINMIGKHF